MDVYSKITTLFDSLKLSYEILNHEPVFTSADAAKIRDTGLSKGAKALVMFADKTPILVVLPGDKKLDMKSFKRVFGVKDLRMATRDEVKNLTTLEVGAIPPVGNVMNLPTYFDSEFKNKDEVAFNAGSHSISIKMKSADLIKAVSPIFGSFQV